MRTGLCGTCLQHFDGLGRPIVTQLFGCFSKSSVLMDRI
jgi:hypothetical protein